MGQSTIWRQQICWGLQSQSRQRQTSNPLSGVASTILADLTQPFCGKPGGRKITWSCQKMTPSACDWLPISLKNAMMPLNGTHLSFALCERLDFKPATAVATDFGRRVLWFLKHLGMTISFKTEIWEVWILAVFKLMWEIEADHLDFFGSLKYFWVWGFVTFRLWETLSNYFSVQSNVGKVKEKNAPICTLVQSTMNVEWYPHCDELPLCSSNISL